MTILSPLGYIGSMVDLINTATAAAIIGCVPRHVGHLIRTGQLPALRVGRDWLLNRKDAERFVRRPPGNPNWRQPADTPAGQNPATPQRWPSQEAIRAT